MSGCSLVVKHQPSKLAMWVRFPSPAPLSLFHLQITHSFSCKAGTFVLMIIPLWAVFGLITAIFSAAMMLMQEHYKVNGYALAFWIKVACVLVSLPFVFLNGVPDNPLFYFYLALSAVLYAISDVYFFSAIPKSSAGSVSRLVPSAGVIGFLLWFIIDPDLFFTYMESPLVSGLIFVTLCLFAFFAFKLKKCTVTMQFNKFIKNIFYVIQCVKSLRMPCKLRNLPI